MKEIKLTQGQVAIVDDEDFDRVNQFVWCALKHHTGKYYAARTDVNNNRKTIRLHRFIMGVCYDNDKIVDHINHDTLDNRKANLRICSRTENAKNRTSKRGSSSKYLGVHKTKEGGFVARAGGGSQRRYLGYFMCEVEAARAYDTAAMQVHGEFANLNFK